MLRQQLQRRHWRPVSKFTFVFALFRGLQPIGFVRLQYRPQLCGKLDLGYSLAEVSIRVQVAPGWWMGTRWNHDGEHRFTFYANTVGRSTRAEQVGPVWFSESHS